MARPAMCWPTRNTVNSKSALLTSWPRPVRARSCRAASAGRFSYQPYEVRQGEKASAPALAIVPALIPMFVGQRLHRGLTLGA